MLTYENYKYNKGKLCIYPESLEHIKKYKPMMKRIGARYNSRMKTGVLGKGWLIDIDKESELKKLINILKLEETKSSIDLTNKDIKLNNRQFRNEHREEDEEDDEEKDKEDDEVEAVERRGSAAEKDEDDEEDDEDDDEVEAVERRGSAAEKDEDDEEKDDEEKDDEEKDDDEEDDEDEEDEEDEEDDLEYLLSSKSGEPFLLDPKSISLALAERSGTGESDESGESTIRAAPPLSEFRSHHSVERRGSVSEEDEDLLKKKVQKSLDFYKSFESDLQLSETDSEEDNDENEFPVPDDKTIALLQKISILKEESSIYRKKTSKKIAKIKHKYDKLKLLNRKINKKNKELKNFLLEIRERYFMK